MSVSATPSSSPAPPTPRSGAITSPRLPIQPCARRPPMRWVGGRQVVVKTALAVAQPQGALVYYAASTGRLRELQDEQSLVIDVGARTFDSVATRGLRLVSKKGHSVNLGVVYVLQALAQQIS